MQPHGRPMTAEELQELPDDGQRHELQAGVLLSEPLPMRPHARIQARLLRCLAEFVEERGMGEVFDATGFVLSRDPDTVRGPDVSFVSADRLAAAPDESRFFPGAPDLAVEIVSPSNRPDEIRAKVADYLAAGSRMVWVVDPGTETVTVYRTLLAPRRLSIDALLDGEDVVPGFALRIETLFRRPSGARREGSI